MKSHLKLWYFHDHITRSWEFRWHERRERFEWWLNSTWSCPVARSLMCLVLCSPVTHCLVPTTLLCFPSCRSPGNVSERQEDGVGFRGWSPFSPKSSFLFRVHSWCWERSKAKGVGSSRGWDGWMASLTQWTWVWAESRRWGRTGKPVMLPCMESQRVEHDLETEQQQERRNILETK